MKSPLKLLLTLLLCCTFTAQAKPILLENFSSAGQKIHVEEIAKGLGIPWGMVFLPEENALLITERERAITQAGHCYRYLPDNQRIT